MRRFALTALVLASFSQPLLSSDAAAGDPKAPAAPQTLASDADAAAALAKFKEDYKAKGLRGDDRLSQRDFAMAALAKLQHPTIVEALAVVSRDPDATLRMLGVVYLGDQRLLPGLAGSKVAAALGRPSVDEVMVLTCLQAIGRLKYLGSRDQLSDRLKDPSFAVKKAAIDAIGKTGDVRLLRKLMAVVGVDVGSDLSGDGKDSGGKEVVQEGYSWEGAEASVDTGASGDGDQKAAEAQARAEIAANRAAAEGSRASSAGGGGGDAPAGGKGGSSRSSKELLPNVLSALRRLTGATFSSPAAFLKWYEEHRKELVEKAKAIDEEERVQKAQAKG